MSVQGEESYIDYAVKILRDAEHWVKRFHDSELKGVNFKLTEDGWLGIVKATHHGKPIVAFASGETLSQTLVNVAWALGNRSLRWKKDQYPIK